MKHKHHIIPKHMGGTDDPSNLVLLTVEEHASAHKLLYEQYGREQDRIAWMALSKQVEKKETIKASLKLGRKQADKAMEEKYGPNFREIISKKGTDKGVQKYKELYLNDPAFRMRQQENQKKGVSAALTTESREKRLETFRKIGHQQGEKNSNFGKMWIHNNDLQLSKMLSKKDPIPAGWAKGRKIF